MCFFHRFQLIRLSVPYQKTEKLQCRHWHADKAWSDFL